MQVAARNHHRRSGARARRAPRMPAAIIAPARGHPPAVMQPFARGAAAAAGSAAGTSPIRPMAASDRLFRTTLPLRFGGRGEAPPRAPACRAVADRAWAWTGSDEFSALRDRVDAPPLPLPPLPRSMGPVRAVLVRHGQSTWNAAKRVQGSTDLSVLTEKGKRQARDTQAMLSGEEFDWVFSSTLSRAAETADIVTAGQPVVPRMNTPLLREVDLYSFQGLLKEDVKKLYVFQYSAWQKQPEEFELDGHFPVRELWHRGSLAWRELLAHMVRGSGSVEARARAAGAGAAASAAARPKTMLVVAHNNMNQAMVATALGLPVTVFRRLVQDNAAVSSLLLTPSDVEGASPVVTLERLNVSSALKSKLDADDGIAARVLLLAHTGDKAAQAAQAALVEGVDVGDVYCGPFAAAQATAAQLVATVAAGGAAEPDMTTLMDAGAALPAEEVWSLLVGRAPTSGGACSVAVLDPNAVSALVCAALGMASASSVRIDVGSATLMEFHGPPADTPPRVRCVNSMTHITIEPAVQAELQATSSGVAEVSME